MGELKTKVNDASVMKYLDTVKNAKQKEESLKILAMMEEVTKLPPKMWGKNMIGFGQYHYKSKSGQEGDWFLTGFAPRVGKISIHIMAGFDKFPDLMDKLGTYKTGVGCLYIKTLDDVDLKVLKQLIKKGFNEMKKNQGMC